MKEKQGKLALLASMAIFGTIGILRRHIPYPSSFIALARGLIGAAFLLAVILLRKEKPHWKAIRKNGLMLLLSGAALGFNWIFLFESYNHTSVATATLCYYLAPILVILISPVLFGEKLTGKKILCTFAALLGMVLVSDILHADFSGLAELKGVGLGLAAAVLYACVMILNKKIKDIDPYDKTIAQLSLAALVMAPYVLLTEDIAAMSFSPLPLTLLAVAGIVHTGIAYWLYFGSIGSLKAQTAAIYSYLDPVLAIVLSMVVLKEPMTPAAMIGAVLILSAAIFSEL